MSVIHLHGIYDAATNMDDIVADQKAVRRCLGESGRTVYPEPYQYVHIGYTWLWNNRG